MRLTRPLTTLTTITGLLTALCLAVAGTATASPPVATSDQPETACSASSGEPTDAVLTEEADSAAASQASQDAEAALKNGEVQVHVPQNAITTSDAVVMSVESDSTYYHSVTFPLEGSGLSLLSNLTVVLTADGAVATYSETLLQQNEAGNFQLTSYTDGSLTQQADSEERFVDDATLQVQLDKISAAVAEQQDTPQEAGVGAVAACLTVVLGIGGGAAWAIAAMCSGSCSAAATGVGAAICAACIGAVATLGTGGISGAVSCFQHL